MEISRMHPWKPPNEVLHSEMFPLLGQPEKRIKTGAENKYFIEKMLYSKSWLNFDNLHVLNFVVGGL